MLSLRTVLLSASLVINVLGCADCHHAQQQQPVGRQRVRVLALMITRAPCPSRRDPPRRRLRASIVRAYRRLDLHVAFRNGLRWPLRADDEVEIWQGQDMLGTVSGDTIRYLLEHTLTTAALQAVLQEELRGRLSEALRPELPSATIPLSQAWREMMRLKRKRKKR